MFCSPSFFFSLSSSLFFLSLPYSLTLFSSVPPSSVISLCILSIFCNLSITTLSLSPVSSPFSSSLRTSPLCVLYYPYPSNHSSLTLLHYLPACFHAPPLRPSHIVQVLDCLWHRFASFPLQASHYPQFLYLPDRKFPTRG